MIYMKCCKNNKSSDEVRTDTLCQRRSEMNQQGGKMCRYLSKLMKNYKFSVTRSIVHSYKYLRKNVKSLVLPFPELVEILDTCLSFNLVLFILFIIIFLSKYF